MPFLDQLPDGVLVAGPDGLVTEVNTMACRMLAAPREELVGRHLRDAVPLDDLQGHHWFDCARPYDGFAARTALAEQSWYTPTGTELLMTGSLLRAAPRSPVDEVVISLRSAKARARRDRDRSDLVATVAHELRSPLTGVKGFTSTLLKKWSRFSDEQRQLMLETVDSDADRLSRLITELLDAARIDSGRLTLRPALVDLPALVQRVLDNLAAGGSTSGTVAADDGVPGLWADADRLIQVVTNLLENALRHGHGIGEVSVRHAGEGRDGAILTVTDRGPGIGPEIRSRVFTRFWKYGERGGSGLGLFIVKGIVDGHQGEVSIGDADGGGARIDVWIPVNEPASMRD
ncbi:MAG: PAS domain-containing sensor histidine kinase [Nocardioidaceae bacterium]|nr:PAS domain-containing sensor histidine kinase [Nocardioidaceae bacterium]